MKQTAVDKTHECDVLVIGSGVSGYCAAIQAGREGVRTILIEKDEVLGGNSGPNLGVGITGADRHNTFATESGVIQELQEEAAWVRGFTQVSPGAMPYSISRRNEAVVQSALEQAGVLVLKRHFARMPIMDGNRITGVIAEDLAEFRTVEIRVSGVVIEASGDGHISAQAGADFDAGSESRTEFDERSAPEERRTWIQGTSLVAIAHKTGRPVEFIPPPGTGEFTPRLWHGRMSTHINHGHGDFSSGKELVFLYMTEAGGDMDTIGEDGEIYEMLLKQLWAEWNHVKNGPHRDESLEWDLLWVSPKAGKRESRRFLGDVILTQTDLEAGRHFPDDIAYGGHDLDDHQSLGAVGSNIFGHSVPPMYGIPFRACYSRNVNNVLLGGRLVSATHLAHSSIRVMRTGAAIGQAVGLAAALCCTHGVTPRELHDAHLDELTQGLMRRDGTILGRSLDSTDDLARTASVSAGSEMLFNDQRPAHMAPLVTSAGNMLHDWPDRLEQVEMYLRNGTDADQIMTLSILRTHRKQPWTTNEIWGNIQWNDLRDSAFNTLAEQTFTLPARFEGWHTITLDEPVKIGRRDATSDADRVIVAMNENSGVWWALNEEPFEICGMVEHSHHDTCWHDIEAMGPMRTTPAIPFGDATNLTNGFHRRFSRGPTNMWISKGAVPQDITLEWPESVTFDRVEVTFDNLVPKRHDNPWECGERVLPMMAKIYELSARADGEWTTITHEECNVHRFRTHTFEPVTADALCLTIIENHGEGGQARVYDVRVYGGG
jgi:hypothetical protein